MSLLLEEVGAIEFVYAVQSALRYFLGMHAAVIHLQEATAEKNESKTSFNFSSCTQITQKRNDTILQEMFSI